MAVQVEGSVITAVDLEELMEAAVSTGVERVSPAHEEKGGGATALADSIAGVTQTAWGLGSATQMAEMLQEQVVRQHVMMKTRHLVTLLCLFLLSSRMPIW